MRKGEKWILAVIAVTVLSMGLKSVWLEKPDSKPEQGIPFYSTASDKLTRQATDLIRQFNCRSCHVFWSVRSPIQNVPSPSLDGIGSLYNEDWFYRYLSSQTPQDIVPSRLKKEYQMPSYAGLSESDRHVLAKYLSHLKVKSWYIGDVRKAEHKALTGEEVQE